MVKKTLFKYSSVLMSVVLIASTLTACGTNTAYNQVQQEVAVSSEAASNTESIISNAIKNELSISNTSTLKTNTRDEMVYVFDKADGTQDHVIVTEKVTDAKGETTTNQSDSTKSAPVSIKVTYKLNGVETKPEDMIGKSGKVTIRYDYTNNEKKNITVNGKTQTAYVPFTMITGTLLPTDKFSNVEVTNGKVSKVGDNVIALGMTMPGLKDTLNLKFDGESLDMDIPEYFEISADVNDFELDMSMSVATTSVLNDVDVDDFSLAKLEDKMDELQSAANQLTDGTVTLQDGTQTLADSIPALTDGVNQLDDGAGALRDGIYAYTDGATALAAGAGQLKTGLKTYTDGVTALNTGSGTLKSGLSTYTAGVKSAATGAGQLQSGLKAYTDGVTAAAAGATELNTGIQSMKSALIGNMVKKLTASAADYRANTVKDANKISVMDQAKALQAGATKAGLANVTIADDLTALASKADGKETSDYITSLYGKYLSAYTVNLMTEIGMAAQSGSQYTPTNTTANTADYIYTNQLGLLISAAGNVGASTALNGVVGTLTTDETVQNGLKALTEGSQSLTDGLNELAENNAALNTGLAQLNAGLVQLNDNSAALNTGATQISAGLSQLNDNNDTLNGGITQIDNGLGTLNSNNGALRDGSSQLADGTSTLKSSSVTLADGVTQLNDGAITLKDGMAEFNETGIKAITSLVGNDADTAVDTIKEVIKLGKNYNTFLGKSDGKEGSVTFVYKTAELTK